MSKRPIKMWIDGKIFSIHKFKSRRTNNRKPDNDEENKELLDIKEDDGRCFTSFRLPMSYYEKIKNVPGFDLGKISEATKTEISCPQWEEGKISFQSANVQGLMDAVNQVQAAVVEAREKSMPLQFVSIPCLDQTVRINFEKLKRELLEMESEVPGLHESIFMSPEQLHVTVDVYSLLDDAEKAEAIQALNDYKIELEKIIEETGPIQLDIRGLECMNQNTSKVNVLYAKVKMVNESGGHNLQNIVNGVSKHFFDRGLSRKYQDNVRIHMTIINTKYRAVKGKKYNRFRWQSIDATNILKKYKDYSFGVCNFDSLHLSHISLKGEDGFYKPIAILNLGPNKDIL